MKIFYFLFFIIITGCNKPAISFDQSSNQFEEIKFNVVEKVFANNTNSPENVNKLLNYWFDNKIKIDGFDGSLKFIVTDYLENESLINNGKKIDIILKFKVTIDQPSKTSSRKISGEVTSYGSLTGDFSIKEFESLIENTQENLIYQLSRDLKSKI